MSKFLKVTLLSVVCFIIVIIIIEILRLSQYVYKQIYPTTYSQYVEKYSLENDLDPLLIYAIIKAESNFNTSAVSNSNALGLMQILETTAKEVCEKEFDEEFDKNKLFNAEYNIKVGTRYFSKLLNKYNNNIGISLAAYNAGTGKVDSWIEDGIIKQDGSNLENIPYKETNNYVRKILRYYDIYKEIYKEEYYDKSKIKR